MSALNRLWFQLQVSVGKLIHLRDTIGFCSVPNWGANSELVLCLVVEPKYDLLMVSRLFTMKHRVQKTLPTLVWIHHQQMSHNEIDLQDRSYITSPHSFMRFMRWCYSTWCFGTPHWWHDIYPRKKRRNSWRMTWPMATTHYACEKRTFGWCCMSLFDDCAQDKTTKREWPWMTVNDEGPFR